MVGAVVKYQTTSTVTYWSRQPDAGGGAVFLSHCEEHCTRTRNSKYNYVHKQANHVHV